MVKNWPIHVRSLIRRFVPVIWECLNKPGPSRGSSMGLMFVFKGILGRDVHFHRTSGTGREKVSIVRKYILIGRT